MKTASAKCCPSCGERYDADVLFCPRDGTPLVSSRSPSFAGIVAERDPYLGLELAGQIKLKSLIGIGSMGRVYRAFQAGIDRDVAVKILHRELSGNAELVGRFHREARVASRLVHANVVQVLMTGNLPGQTDLRVGGELYLVMEHLDGISLLSALAAAAAGEGDRAALPLPRALHIALQVCDAVGEAHAQGIVHRDLKPENVMLVRRGEDPDYVKVLDFGIARLTWVDRSMATQAGLIFGTAKYISPEGAEGHPVGPSADVYSIATMLYECLAGRTPFEADSHVTLLMHHAHTTPPPLTSVARASYVPAPIAGVIMQNLAKKPSNRAADARVLGRDLIAAARESGLFPESIVSQSALLLSARPGSVKLASKERTKALELSADVAARISAAPARSSEPPDESEVSRKSGGAESTPQQSAPEPAQSADPKGPTSSPETTAQTQASARDAAEPTAEKSGVPSASLSSIEAGRSSATPVSILRNEIDTGVALAADSTRLAEVPLPSTLQGTETPLQQGEPSAQPSRARAVKIAAVAASLAIAVFAAFVGGSRIGKPQAAADTMEAQLEDARDCMRRHAWDDPEGPNVKDITDRALARSPSDPRIKEIRREAAERIVTDALGRKYAGDVNGALRLTRLALELSPALVAAQHLTADLEALRAAAPSPSAESSAPAQPAPLKTTPHKGSKEPKSLKSSGSQPGAADHTPTELPPSPSPLSTTQTPPAPPEPWL